MTRMFSRIDEASITEAANAAMTKTTAKIVPVLLTSSDTYNDVLLFMGLILGSLLSSLFWLTGIERSWPWLLVLQFIGVIMVDRVQPVERFCLSILPEKTRHHRAQRLALEEYHTLAHSLPHDQPIVLFFVSMTERYVHVITSPSVKKLLPNEHWQSVTGQFITNIKPKGLKEASLEAINRITELLSPHFPVKL